MTVRRLHDTNRSGWSMFFGLIPFIGGLMIIRFLLDDGTSGPNQYGPDPKEISAGTTENAIS